MNERDEAERDSAEPGVAPVDPDARATGRAAGMPGTQPAEFLAGTEPGDKNPPPAVPKLARDRGVKEETEG